MKFFAPSLDLAVIGKLAQHMLEHRPIGILQSEGTRNLAGADFARLSADEGDEFVFGRDVRLGVGSCHE